MATDVAEDLAGVLARLRGVHASGRTRPIAWRLAQLDGIGRLLEEREAEIAAAQRWLWRRLVAAKFGDGLLGEYGVVVTKMPHPALDALIDDYEDESRAVTMHSNGVVVS